MEKREENPKKKKKKKNTTIDHDYDNENLEKLAAIESTTTLRRNRPSWEDLPHHILELFLKPILQLIDQPNLSRVCKAWRHFKPAPDSCFPTLVDEATICKFIKGGGSDEYEIKTCVGSSHGWLIIRLRRKKYCHPHGERFYLLNIYTKDTIQLPVLYDYYAGWPQICLSSAPTDPDCMVLMFDDVPIKEFLFSKRGWNKWIKSDCKYLFYSKPDMFEEEEEKDSIHYLFPFEEKFYALTRRGNLVAIDIINATAAPTTTVLPVNSILFPTVWCNKLQICGNWIQYPPEGYIRTYDWFWIKSLGMLLLPVLIESLGKLLAVRLYRREKDEEIINLDVLELDFKTMSWIKVKNVPGDQVLFISWCSSFSISGSEIGIRGNCIYVLDHVLGKIHRYDMHNQEMIVCTDYPPAALPALDRDRRLWLKPTFV